MNRSKTMTALDERYKIFEERIKRTRIKSIMHPELYGDAYALGLDLDKLDTLVNNPWAYVEVYILLIKNIAFLSPRMRDGLVTMPKKHSNNLKSCTKNIVRNFHTHFTAT